MENADESFREKVKKEISILRNLVWLMQIKLWTVFMLGLFDGWSFVFPVKPTSMWKLSVTS